MPYMIARTDDGMPKTLGSVVLMIRYQSTKERETRQFIKSNEMHFMSGVK